MEHKVQSDKTNVIQLSKSYTNLNELTRREKQNIFNSFDLVFCDCDGVIWQTIYEALPGVTEAIDYLKREGKQVTFVTNNSIVSIDKQLSKFRKCGLEVKKHDIVHPAQTICNHLKSIQFNGLIFCLATDVFKTVLRDAGFNLVDGCTTFIETTDELRDAVYSDDPVKAVIIDVDLNMSAAKLMRAHWHLTNDPECLFFGGAADTLISFHGKDVIGPGPYISIVEKTAKRQALIFGKPGVALRDVLMQRYNITNPQRILFIGDSLVTDVRFGKVCGFQTLLVLSGQTKREDLQSNREHMETPDYVVDSLSDLNGFLTQ
ncbi:uncharacterized protein [Eurosta solidaginis]|uniref:uncharacterized protein n=1 Tax=Eurosta solidaginis TaxID=178769 RepID=UPI0035313EF1